jgi:hypothetical protein
MPRMPSATPGLLGIGGRAMDRLPSREELELQASIYRTNQQIVDLANAAWVKGTNINELPEDVQQSIRDARAAIRGD